MHVHLRLNALALLRHANVDEQFRTAKEPPILMARYESEGGDDDGRERTKTRVVTVDDWRERKRRIDRAVAVFVASRKYTHIRSGRVSCKKDGNIDRANPQPCSIVVPISQKSIRNVTFTTVV